MPGEIGRHSYFIIFDFRMVPPGFADDRDLTRDSRSNLA